MTQPGWENIYFRKRATFKCCILTCAINVCMNHLKETKDHFGKITHGIIKNNNTELATKDQRASASVNGKECLL